MYTYREACRYINGRWEFVDIQDKTIWEILSESRLNIITVNVGNDIAVLSPNDLYAITDKTQVLKQYLYQLTIELPILEEDYVIQSSVYRDVTDIHRIGNDYVIEHQTPFLITGKGLWTVEDRVARDIDATIQSIGFSMVGEFDVGLPYTKHSLSYEDCVRKRGHIPKRFSYNNTIMVFGDSIIKINTILHDIGDAYIYNTNFRSVIADLFIENLDKIPPTMVGIDPTLITRDIFDDDVGIARILTHPAVYFVEYIHDYPIGLEITYPDREVLGEYSESLAMIGNKPTMNKVIHRHDKFLLKDGVMEHNMKHYLDDAGTGLMTEDMVLRLSSGKLFTLDYPVFKFKERT